jgi:hypothetical protein
MKTSTPRGDEYHLIFSQDIAEKNRQSGPEVNLTETLAVYSDLK